MESVAVPPALPNAKRARRAGIRLVGHGKREVPVPPDVDVHPGTSGLSKTLPWAVARRRKEKSCIAPCCGKTRYFRYYRK